MQLHGFNVSRIDDNTYSVSNSSRVLGHVVRYWVPQPDGTLLRRFRFWDDFNTLADAVASFRRLRNSRG